MSTLSDAAVTKGIELLTTATDVAKGLAPKLMSQFLDYMLFLSVMNIIKTASIMLLIYAIVRALSGFIKADSAERSELDERIGKLSPEDDQRWTLQVKQKDLTRRLEQKQIFRRLVLSAGVLGVLILSIPEFKVIGKILIAPQLYVMEEGAKAFVQFKEKSASTENQR